MSQRILVVTPSLPYPPNWGFGIRVFQFLKHLSRTHQVSLVCYAHPGEEAKIAALEKICHAVYTAPAPIEGQSDKRFAQFASLFSPRSFASSSLRSPAMQELLARLLASEDFDIVQIESSQLGSYPYGSKPALIVDEHNLEYELLYRMYQTERSPLRRLYNRMEYTKFRREEQHCWQRSDACILTSEREQKILRAEMPGKPTHVAPNGVDIEYFQPSAAPIDANSLVFTGLISYRPNTDAVLFFVQEVLPHIVKARPEAVFSIVGMGPPEEVLRLAGPNVTVTGEVPDVRPYIQNASLFVVPLRMGSGTRLKVLEGLAMGKAMVSTRLGCEGINVRDGEHLLMEDEPQAFAEAVLRLMDDREFANRLGAAGRALVEQNYSWGSIVQTMEQFHLDVLAKKRQGVGHLGSAYVATPPSR